MNPITIYYSSRDSRKVTVRHYKTLKGAQRFAHKMLGPHPEMGRNYAVSDDGIAKIDIGGAIGCSLNELFPS